MPSYSELLSCTKKGNEQEEEIPTEMNKERLECTNTEATLMNEEFVKFHGNIFSSEDLIFDKLTTIICKKVSLPKTVIACLVRTRTYIRLRHINNLIKQRNCTRKKNKKIKHMCNKQC